MNRTLILLALVVLALSSTGAKNPEQTRPVREGFVQSKNQRIHYLVTGSGPFLVMVHGMFGRAQDWFDSGWVERLALSHTLVIIDMRGHGLSDKPTAIADYSLDTMAEDVIAVMDTEGIARTDYLGFSMGGKVAYSLMGRHVDRFGSFVIVSASPGAYDLSDYRKMLKNDFPDHWVFPDYPVIDDDYKRYFRSLNKESLLALTDDSNWTDRTRLYVWCQKPVLVFYGADEPESDKKDMREKGQYAAKSTIIEIPGCDHIGLMVSSGILAPTVLEFLTGKRE